MNRDIANMRENYEWGYLLEKGLYSNPYDQFRLWMDDAINSKVVEANAMTLSTISRENRPSSRIVLLKEIDEDGFIFYTNYSSRKAEDLAYNPFASLNFLWKEIERQVRIEGRVSKVSKERSEAYFHSRPFGSQVGALTSAQSEVIERREDLDVRYKKLFAKFEAEGKVPLPDHWGGYKLEADYFEFWQGRKSRLHDRIRYQLTDKEWKIARLEP